MADRINTPFTNEHFADWCQKMVGQPYWYGTCVYSDHCEQEGHSQEHQYPFLHIPIHQGYKITYFPRKTLYLPFSFIIY